MIAMVEWWNAQTGTLIGAIGGGGLGGVVGGVCIPLLCVLANKGKARRVVIPLHTAIVACSALILFTGLYAVVAGQPYHVWYPLVLIGGIMAVVCGSLLPVTVGGYRRAEQRRLESQMMRHS